MCPTQLATLFYPGAVLLSTSFVAAQSNDLWPHGLQHASLACPSPSPRACSNSSPLSQWCHPAISSSISPFSSCPQCFPASGSFLISRLSESGGQSIGASASVLPVNIQDWFPLGLTCLISLFDQQGVIMLFSLNIYQLCIFSFKIILIIFYIKSKISLLF